MKVLFISLLILLTSSISLADKTEWIHEEIAGVPKAVEIESMTNWRAACRDFEKSKPDGSYVLEVECGVAKCTDNDYEILCTSRGKKLIKYDKP